MCSKSNLDFGIHGSEKWLLLLPTLVLSIQTVTIIF